MKLVIKKVIDREICHYASPDTLITSLYNRIYVKKHDDEFSIQLPSDGWNKIFGFLRLTRRALRLDKCNVIPVGNDDFVVIRQGKVFHYCKKKNALQHVLNLRNCRNVLHQSIAVVDQNDLFFGEYGNNGSRLEVPIYRSSDRGRNWSVVYSFPKGETKHVHGCYYDPFEQRIWVLTGDFENECHILCSGRDFRDIEYIGDGQQTYRACNLFFEKDAVHWIMDSQLQDSYHVKLDRKTRTIEKKQMFPGPVWYIKRLQDGYYLAATAQEIGPGVHDQYAHLMISEDLEKWEDIYQFTHDGLPKRYFKFGVIGFADGPQTTRCFYLFAEAIQGLDGKIALCEIKD